jgi:hypothetical protein
MEVFMRARLLFGLALVIASLTGCPGTSPAGVDAATADSGGGTDSGDGVDSGGTVDSGGGSDAATSPDANVADSGGADDAGPSDAGPASFTVAIVEPYGYGNCFPAPPDPLFLGWTARVTGPVGDTITLTQATLHVVVASPSHTEDQLVTVAVPTFPIPVGGTIDQEQRKVTGTPVVPVCDYCDTAVVGTLTTTYTSSGGGSVTTTTPIDSLGCVF